MKTQNQVQEEAGKAIVRNNGRGMLVMATGTGKSKVAIDYAKMKHHLNPRIKILLVVPTEKLRDVNWKDEFTKWNADFLWEYHLDRSCYVSISKLKDKFYDLVILDEAHNITVNNSQFFKQNIVLACIGLTATPPPEEIKKALLKEQRLNPVYEVTLDEAVEWGLVSPYKITVVQTSLDSNTRNIKSGTKDKVFYTTELKTYEYLTQQIASIDVQTATTAMLARRKMFILKRLHFIYALPSKTMAAQFLLNKVIPVQERTLIFAGSIIQAETLCEHSFHSKSSNSSFYDAFKAETINRLSSVRSLNQGENIANLDNALVVQINSKELDIVQRVGRVVRYRNGHLAQIYILCVKNTVDTKWLETALSDFDRSRIEYIDYPTLKMNYDDNKPSNQIHSQTV